MNFFLNRLFEDPFLISFADFFSYLKKKKNSGRFCKGLSLHRRKERIHPTSSLRSQARALSMSRFPPPASLQGRVGLSGSLKTLRRASKVEVLQETSRSLVRRTSISLPVFFHTNVSVSSSRVLAAASSSEACGGSEGSEGARPLSYLLHLHPPFLWWPLFSKPALAHEWDAVRSWLDVMGDHDVSVSSRHPAWSCLPLFGGPLIGRWFPWRQHFAYESGSPSGSSAPLCGLWEVDSESGADREHFCGAEAFFASDAAALSNPPRGFCPRR